ASRTGGAGAAIGGDPITELRITAHETPAGTLRVVPLILPLSVDQQSHDCAPMNAAGYSTLNAAQGAGRPLFDTWPAFSVPALNVTNASYCATASRAMSSVTSSLTPGAYLPALNSVRLITAVALAPIASFFSMGCGP